MLIFFFIIKAANHPYPCITDSLLPSPPRNPTQTQVPIIPVKWEPVVEGSLRYLSINTTFNTSMHYNYRQTQASFWTHYMPTVVREWVPTPPPPIDVSIDQSL